MATSTPTPTPAPENYPFQVRCENGDLLEIIVLSCDNMNYTDKYTGERYISLDYGKTVFRTRTCTDPVTHTEFQEKTVYKVLEGVEEVDLSLWNKNKLKSDDCLGSAKIQLQKVLSEGSHDVTVPVYSKDGRYVGQVSLKMRRAKASDFIQPKSNFKKGIFSDHTKQ